MLLIKLSLMMNWDMEPVRGKKSTGGNNVSNIEKWREMIIIRMLGWLLLGIIHILEKDNRRLKVVNCQFKERDKSRGRSYQHFKLSPQPEGRKSWGMGPELNYKWQTSQMPHICCAKGLERNGVLNHFKMRGLSEFKIFKHTNSDILTPYLSVDSSDSQARSWHLQWRITHFSERKTKQNILIETE